MSENTSQHICSLTATCAGKPQKVQSVAVPKGVVARFNEAEVVLSKINEDGDELSCTVCFFEQNGQSLKDITFETDIRFRQNCTVTFTDVNISKFIDNSCGDITPDVMLGALLTQNCRLEIKAEEDDEESFELLLTSDLIFPNTIYVSLHAEDLELLFG